jgi:hypothetical protein
MSSVVAGIAVILSLLYLALRARIHFTQSADEPPAVLTTLPFWSPIIGVLRRRHKLYVDLLYV